ncbi:MAG: hypothetical protein WCA27_30185 [Candidatus Sulfotelmatobacter sp.]
MRIPQTVMGTAVVVLAILLFTSPRHRVPVYSASNERTVQGVVQDVQEFYCPISGDVGTHLLVKAEDGTFQVHVGPTRFLNDNKLSVSKGDQIQVVGSRIIYHGQEALIARTVVRGNQTLAFREPNGKPMWAE